MASHLLFGKYGPGANELYTYTVCEDQPKLDRWDVEIRTFPTRAKAEAFMRSQYDAKERAGEDEMCVPRLRNDASGEYVS